MPEGIYKHVKCSGLHGTYDDGLEWLKNPDIAARPKTILSLGSSIGNFTRPEAAAFVNQFATVLRSGDTMLIGIDSCQDPEKVFHAYNDMEGLTHEFVLNGLWHANRLLGTEHFKREEWRVIGEYVYDETGGRHQAFVTPLKDVSIDDILIRQGERIRIEESYKWSAEEVSHLWNAAGVVEGCKWSHYTGEYGKWLVSSERQRRRLLLPFCAVLRSCCCYKHSMPCLDIPESRELGCSQLSKYSFTHGLQPECCLSLAP